jgi:adenylate cyclase class 2
LTYKGPKEQHQIKKRPEIEIQITNAHETENLLRALGYKLILTVEKQRKLWKLNECEIALDELPLLGTYVEIEGPDAEKIAMVQKAINLEHLSHINQSYACLIQKQSKQKA